MYLKTCHRNAEIKSSQVQTHNFVAYFTQNQQKLEMGQSSSNATISCRQFFCLIGMRKLSTTCRVERWPPHYRNMGVGDNFHFQAVQGKDASQPMWQPGLNYAQELVEGRQTGSGNSALGLVPGPAPPR